MAIFVGIQYALSIVLSLSLVVWLLVYASKRATSLAGSCRKCGYDLRLSPNPRACPNVVNEKIQAIS